MLTLVKLPGAQCNPLHYLAPSLPRCACACSISIAHLQAHIHIHAQADHAQMAAVLQDANAHLGGVEQLAEQLGQTQSECQALRAQVCFCASSLGMSSEDTCQVAARLTVQSLLSSPPLQSTQFYSTLLHTQVAQLQQECVALREQAEASAATSPAAQLAQIAHAQAAVFAGPPQQPTEPAPTAVTIEGVGMMGAGGRRGAAADQQQSSASSVSAAAALEARMLALQRVVAVQEQELARLGESGLEDGFVCGCMRGEGGRVPVVQGVPARQRVAAVQEQELAL